MRAGLNWLDIESSSGPLEHDNKTSDPIKGGGEFLTSCITISFSRRTLLHGIISLLITA
jgi:hypothetical protein